MIEPNYRVYRIDGPVINDTIITLGNKAFRESITLLKGRYVTVIVLADNETQVEQITESGIPAGEIWNPPPMNFVAMEYPGDG